jgi:hypothetical protein
MPASRQAALAGLFVRGFAVIVNEAVFKGIDAFTLHPGN